MSLNYCNALKESFYSIAAKQNAIGKISSENGWK